MASTREKIVEILKENGQQSVWQLSDILDISLSMTHRHLNVLLDKKVIQKTGAPPRVYYMLASEESEIDSNNDSITIDQEIRDIIEDTFFSVSARGEKGEGWKGFVRWCKKRKFDIVARAHEYVKIYDKYNALRTHGVLSGKARMQNVFGEKLCLQDVFYADFYAWEVFGKTKRGQLLLYAKQSQDRKMMRDVAQSVRPLIETLMKEKNIDAVGFIAPTVQRQTQFMKVFQKALALAVPHIEIIKIKTEVITPQKTLNKLEDRIENADYTFHVASNRKYTRVLLIDDAVGSGATLNQVACKVKKALGTKKVYGFAIVGSAKGFDVISEV